MEGVCLCFNLYTERWGVDVNSLEVLVGNVRGIKCRSLVVNKIN